jgi:hypothetical protein
MPTQITPTTQTQRHPQVQTRIAQLQRDDLNSFSRLKMITQGLRAALASPVAAFITLLGLIAVSALASPASALAKPDHYSVPFPIGGGYTVLGGDLAKLFPGTYGTVHYALGGGWDCFGFDIGVRMVFLQQPDNSPWVSAPFYGAVGPGFFFDIPLDDDEVWYLGLRTGVNISWVGVMYEANDPENPDAPANERILLYGPSVELSARLSYEFKGYGIRLFSEVSNEWTSLQNNRRGRYADGYLLHMTAGFAMGYDL